jgi:hypothetical protein
LPKSRNIKNQKRQKWIPATKTRSIPFEEASPIDSMMKMIPLNHLLRRSLKQNYPKIKRKRRKRKRQMSHERIDNSTKSYSRKSTPLKATTTLPNPSQSSTSRN